MAFVTKYGTVFGQLPQQLGRVIFVAPSASYAIDGRSYVASDDNDGLSPERALLTLSQALTVSRSGEGETVFLLRGTHAQTATLRWNKSVAIIGEAPAVEIPGVALGSMPPAILSFVGAAAPGLSIEADGVTLAHLTLRPAPAFGTVIFRNASPDNFVAHNVVIDFSKGQPSLDTAGIDFGYRANTAGLATRSMSRLSQTTQLATAYLHQVRVLSNGAYGPGIITATADVTFVGGRFQNRIGVWATAFAVATGTGYVHIANSSWGGQGVSNIGVSIDGTNAGIISGKVRVQDCRFGARNTVVSNSSVDNFAPGVVEVIESYEGNNAAGQNPAVLGVATSYQVVSSV